MIRISAGRDAILRGLGDEAGSWLGQARALTNENHLARRHQKRESLWSRTKTVLAALQGHLCAYCGRRLGDAGQDWTVDHFRPKGAVAACDILPAGAVDVGGRSATGYYLLAYELANFLVVCAPCNRSKADYFPTARPRQVDTADKAVLRTEEPLLLNPTDADDRDPALLLSWHGPLLLPAPDLPPYDHARAIATIHVLDLNREEVLRDRAYVLHGMALSFDLPPDHPLGRPFLDGVRGPGSAHASCAIAFGALWETDEASARAIALQLSRLIRG